MFVEGHDYAFEQYIPQKLLFEKSYAWKNAAKFWDLEQIVSSVFIW